MSRFLVSVLAAAALTASLTGCGGSKASAPTTATSTATAARTSSDPSAALNLAVRQALRENYQLSGYVLWHNAVPRSAQRSTRGPALAGLRSAAAQRRQRGIRIRPVTARLTIISVVLDASLTRATAKTLASGRVRPYEAGRAQGHDIAVHERARVHLRRLGHSQQFVVWQVTLLR
jgi:hypothetical protein